MTAVDGMDDDIKELVEKYKLASANLVKWKKENRPFGSVVYVECDQYTGFGIIQDDASCRPEQLSVRLGNDNVWWYPLEQTTLADRHMNNWPNWIRREKKLTTKTI
jgi:hypothetical protein